MKTIFAVSMMMVLTTATVAGTPHSHPTWHAQATTHTTFWQARQKLFQDIRIVLRLVEYIGGARSTP